jgi:NADH-quinone oxidoreductase subunit L
MEATIEMLMVLIPALPLAAAILTAILGPKLLKQWSHVPVILAIAASSVCSLALMRDVHQAQQAFDKEAESARSGVSATTEAVAYQHIYRVWTWLDIHDAARQNGRSVDLALDVVLRVDGLTSIMLAMVTFIATLVAIFAAGYMQGDRSYWRFFSYVGLFVFSMTMLVSVSNFILLFVFWEAVGVCSYLLIGFWYEKPEAAAAGKKAFLVNRVGDFGFALALFLIWTTYGTLNFHDVTVSGDVISTTVEEDTSDEGLAVQGVLSPSRIAENNYVTGGVALAICLLLMLGACGKSAQFPLHVWLPDAMEGPTPVSALIHAATMVTAGVYMVTRCTPLFMASPEAQLVVSIIGGITALLAGLIALTQYDLKRVLAYSTVSQLGYMFLALGTGTLAGIAGGMFHLFTHAFFKALLFLGAGSVMYAMHHIIDMRRFSGLRKIMPATHATFLIGCLALAGVWPLSGFWSKDAVVASVHDRVHQLEHLANPHGPAHGEETTPAKADTSPLSKLSHEQLERMATAYEVLYYLALFVAFLTAFYTFRAFFMTFYGEEKVPYEVHGHAHESPPLMTVPLMVLSIFAAIVGAVLFASGAFDNFLLHTPSLAAGWANETLKPGAFHMDVAWTSSIVAFAGIGLAFYLYNGGKREVDWFYYVMNWDWLHQATEGAFVSSLQQIPLVRFINRWAPRIYLGWLVRLIGNLILLVVLVLSVPLTFFAYISPYRLSYGKFFFDEIYNVLIVWPLRIIAQLAYWIDRTIIDGLVNLCGKIPTAFGNLMRSMQFGLVPFYALAMVLGAVVLLAAKLLWAQ